MSQTLIRLYFMLALLVLSAHSRKYRPKIFLASEKEVPEEQRKEIFWHLGQHDSPVVWIKSSGDPYEDLLCDRLNETLADHNIHAGRVLVLLFEAKTDCELNPEVPVLKWYFEEEEKDENAENSEGKPTEVFSPTWLDFSEGNLTPDGGSTLSRQLRHAIKRATKNKEEFNARRNEKVSSTSSFWMFVIIGLGVFIILVAVFLFCYRKNQEKQKAKEAEASEAAKKAAEEKLAKEKAEKDVKVKENVIKALKTARKANSASVSTESDASRSWKSLANALGTSRPLPSPASGANEAMYQQPLSADAFLRPPVPPPPPLVVAARSTATPCLEPGEIPYRSINPPITMATPPPPLLKETQILTPLTPTITVTPTKPSTPLKTATSSTSVAKSTSSSEKKNPKSPIPSKTMKETAL